MSKPWQFFKSFPLKDSVNQEKWLLDCLSRNSNSLYGKYYDFDRIKKIADYQKMVPIVHYEQLMPWINRLEQEDDVLFTEPVVAFERTGGSHSGGKLIPYSATGLADFRKALLAWLAELIDYHALNDGYAYWALSPSMVAQQTSINEIPIGGGDALYMGADNLNAFIQLSAVPFSVASIEDLTEWQLVTLYYLIKCYHLRLVSIWSPSFLLVLLSAIKEQKLRLLTLFYHGGVVAGHSLKADKSSAKRLEAYLEAEYTALLWPHLKVISCWSDASSSLPAKKLKQYFPQAYLQPKGLLSTEAIITAPDVQGNNLLCLSSNFYEFLDSQGSIYLADSLSIERTYQVIVTTNSGLYRYHTGDQVICLGYQGIYPILQFMGRVGIVSDKVGEKLTEVFVSECLEDLQQIAMLAYDTERGGYILLLENKPDNLKETIFQVEQKLCNNPQYKYARQLKQLTPLTYFVIPNLSERYISSYVKNGKRLGDIKPPVLLLIDWRELF